MKILKIEASRLICILLCAGILSGCTSTLSKAQVTQQSTNGRAVEKPEERTPLPMSNGTGVPSIPDSRNGTANGRILQTPTAASDSNQAVSLIVWLEYSIPVGESRSSQLEKVKLTDEAQNIIDVYFRFLQSSHVERELKDMVEAKNAALQSLCKQVVVTPFGKRNIQVSEAQSLVDLVDVLARKSQ